MARVLPYKVSTLIKLIMADHLIPEDVRQFIVDKIDSVAELEGLLLLSRNPETEWNIEALAQRLYASREQTEDVLAHLYSLGFLTVKESESLIYRYQPKSPHVAELVDRVAESYSKYLVPVTNLIHSKPQTKVQQFADAFKFRKKEDK
jgi:hypothetical protein